MKTFKNPFPFIYVNILGAPGSGKSRLAKIIQENLNFHITDLDAIVRKYGVLSMEDIHIIRINDLLSNSLKNNVIFDAFLSTPEDRILLNYVMKHLSKRVLIVLNTPLEVCIENDKNREFSVGEDHVRICYNRVILPKVNEGFDAIIYYSSDQQVLERLTKILNEVTS